MRLVFQTAIALLALHTAGQAADKYPMAGLSTFLTVEDIEKSLPEARVKIAEFNATNASLGLKPLEVQASDRCFAGFGITTDTGRFISYQLDSRQTPKFSRTMTRQCAFDPASKVETCSGDKDEKEYYLYPDPANRLRYVLLNDRNDAESYSINPALITRDAKDYLSCDAFRDKLTPFIDSGSAESEDVPLFVGTVLRAIATDEAYAKALKEKAFK